MKTGEQRNDKRPWQGLLSGMALTLCASVPAFAFGAGFDGPRGEGDDGGPPGSFAAGGDETVGTLPSSNVGDDTGNVGGHGAWGQFLTPGGSLRLEGSAVALMTTITSIGGQPRLDIEALEGGRQRWTLGGDFDLALDLQLLAHSGIAISVGNPLDAWTAVELRGRDLGQTALAADQVLDLPLVAFVQSGHVPSGLTVTSVDGYGTATRLSVVQTRKGLLLSQRNALIE